MKTSTVIADLYSLLCAFALLLVPATAYGWFGLQRDSPGAVFAIILSLPWSGALQWAGDLHPWTATILLAFCMALNIVIIRSIGGWRHRRRRMNPE